MPIAIVKDNEYINVANTIKNIKTYKLVEIPVNGGNSINLSCPIQAHQIFTIGGKYKIITRVLEKLYECKAYIDIEETTNQCMDIVIMKQIGGPYNNGWALSESDCEHLKINYESGLLVFPATYDFKKVVK